MFCSATIRALGLFAILSLSATGSLCQAQSPQLSASPLASTDGVSVLSWQTTPPGQAVELQRSQNANFTDAETLYRGSDGASVITGLPDGSWSFRLRLVGQPSWSDPVTVEVQHHPLSRALGFFILGAVVFSATLGLILLGTRHTKRS